VTVRDLIEELFAHDPDAELDIWANITFAHDFSHPHDGRMVHGLAAPGLKPIVRARATGKVLFLLVGETDENESLYTDD
jgi:hypothetical protein